MMKHAYRTWLALIAAATLVAGCATPRDADEPVGYAELVADWPSLADDIYPAWISNVSGVPIPQDYDRRRYVRLEPGTYDVVLTADLSEADRAFRTRYAEVWAQPGIIEITVEAGQRYYVGAHFVRGRIDTWEPRVWKVEPIERTR
jgi:hypothetical protein